jgi:hypothetical protein
MIIHVVQLKNQYEKRKTVLLPSPSLLAPDSWHLSKVTNEKLLFSRLPDTRSSCFSTIGI